MADPVTHFTATAHAVAAAVTQLPSDAWEGPGLGEWSLRDLVGHTSRALVTVVEYLARPVDHEDLDSPAAYLSAIGASGFDAAAVTERGRQAGRDLGEDPAARFDQLVAQAVRVAETTDPDLVVHTVAGGMRVAAYLPTRTFELCVHGLDVEAATGVTLVLPAPALEAACVLAATTAVRGGQGRALLLAATGRRDLPSGFSVV